MKPILYFLRSSEQKITTDMLTFAMRLDKLNKTLQDFPQLNIYDRYYGLSSKDLGLYALYEHTIAGAVWIRLLRAEDGANGFVDANTPVLNIAVKPEFRGKGIGSAMLEQLLLEAGAVFEQISVSVVKNSKAVKFYEKFGFAKVEASEGKSPVDESEVFTMLKKLVKKEVVRPSDGYDPRKWMD
ncbi:MAG: GNAT family N-acetyltransferase [Campylobacterota bacterium]|nr:GNAT family N-acetyltransferase [Campylobacterota bacterium]